MRRDDGLNEPVPGENHEIIEKTDSGEYDEGKA